MMLIIGDPIARDEKSTKHPGLKVMTPLSLLQTRSRGTIEGGALVVYGFISRNEGDQLILLYRPPVVLSSGTCRGNKR